MCEILEWRSKRKNTCEWQRDLNKSKIKSGIVRKGRLKYFSNTLKVDHTKEQRVNKIRYLEKRINIPNPRVWIRDWRNPLLLPVHERCGGRHLRATRGDPRVRSPGCGRWNCNRFRESWAETRRFKLRDQLHCQNGQQSKLAKTYTC